MKTKPLALSFLCLAAFTLSAADTTLASAPQGMVFIKGGEFTMGTDDAMSFPNERPAHPVRVNDFWMDAREVTNDEFAKFVEATGYITIAERKPDWAELKKQLPPGTEKPSADVLVPGALVFIGTKGPVNLRDITQWWSWVPGANWKQPDGPGSDIKDKGNYPVVMIAWDDAVAYAKWAGKRLPTEAEWEYASRGGLENKRFPWGDEFAPNGEYQANVWTGKFPYENTAADGFKGAAPVASFKPNAYGLYDMAGNVWEWCSDWYATDIHQRASKTKPQDNPQGPEKCYDVTDPYAHKRVVKGGSFLCHYSYCESYRPSARRGEAQDTGMSHIGFRCVKDADSK